jgi:2-dehydro-3-deoxyphosphogluconate aldolase/(4S)-4-hydroxy-2-oxoglutarate aldolase
MREKIIDAILDRKIIAIVRGIYGEDCLRLVRALYAGGIRLMEVTFDQAKPESFADTQAAIRMIHDGMDGEVLAGAGTVTTPALVDLAHEAGAKYIIAPNVDAAVIRRTRELGLVSIPGAFTATEVLHAHQLGADFVKLFPTSQLGAGYIKALRGPINHVRLLAVGGVNPDNIAEFVKAGVVGAGVGGNLANKEWVRAGRFDEITRLAAKFVEALQ